MVVENIPDQTQKQTIDPKQMQNYQNLLNHFSGNVPGYQDIVNQILQENENDLNSWITKFVTQKQNERISYLGSRIWNGK